MKIGTSSPCFCIYPSALEEGMLAFGRVGAPGARIVLALEHPKFRGNELSEIQNAYSERVTPSAQPGIEIILCEPQRNALRRLELIEHLTASKVKLGVRGLSAVPGVVDYHYEDASRSDCFGGWPCVALVPTTECRLLKVDVRTMWPDAIPEVQVRAASFLEGAAGFTPDVQFLRFGVPVDADQTTLLQLGQWAEAGEDVAVQIGVVGGDVVRVPLRFETAYAKEGQRAARAAVENRRPVADAVKELRQAAVAFLGVAAVLGSVVYGLRSRVHWELDGLRTELSGHGLSPEQHDAKAARWNQLQRRLHSTSNGKKGGKPIVLYEAFEPVPEPRGGRGE